MFIYIWKIIHGYFYNFDQRINTQSCILEMRSNLDFLFTQSDSEYILFYDRVDFKKKSLDNEEKVVTMCLFQNCVITCDIQNDIRL